MFATLNDIMSDEKNKNIASILISTGENAQIYVRDDEIYKHETFKLSVPASRANYNLAHKDIFDPEKIYERAIAPEQFEKGSPLLKAAQKFRKASWANHSSKFNTLLERINIAPKESFNRVSMEKVSETINQMLIDLVKSPLENDVIPGTGHIAAKYTEDGKTNLVIMPTNSIQKKAIDALAITGGLNDAKKVLKALQASTAEHFKQELPKLNAV